MKRTSWMWMQIGMVWWMFALFAANVHAETLVRSAPTVSGANWSWQKPQDAVALQVRDSVPWVLIQSLAEDSRIYVCKDDPAVAVGTQAVCSTRYNTTPNRDNWAPKSAIFAVAPPAETGNVAIAWTPVTSCSFGVQMVSCEPKGYWVFVRPDPCALSATNCEPTAYGDGVFVTATRFEFRGLVGKHLTSVQAESADGNRGALSDEVPITPTKLTLIPGKVTGVRQE
jgi:hypothetical protein